MANQKEMREMRENVITQLAETVELEGFEPVGQIVEGMLYLNTATESYLVLKPIAKKESFDPEDALQEFADKETARLEREQEKAKKKAEREAKKKEKEEE
jgi:hypothetical protein